MAQWTSLKLWCRRFLFYKLWRSRAQTSQVVVSSKEVSDRKQSGLCLLLLLLFRTEPSFLPDCHPLQSSKLGSWLLFFQSLKKFIYLFYFTILYWFCHTLTWIRHRCTCVPCLIVPVSGSFLSLVLLINLPFDSGLFFLLFLGGLWFVTDWQIKYVGKQRLKYILYSGQRVQVFFC